MVRTSILLLLLAGHNVACLSDTPRFTKVISTKNNGLSQTYSLLAQEQTRSSQHEAALSSRQSDDKSGMLSQVTAGLRSTFLPSGYPKSTPDGYLSYAVWSWIQDLSTQLRGVLATQRVLEGVGVGREGATALSALLNFLIRDGCGMAANLLFTASSSSKFSADVKRWRLFADVILDIGITLEVAATIVPKTFFLPMISVGNMCKAMCGVAAGAVGGVFNLHWAKGSDIADIQAKFGAQHTVTGSLGLVFAALFAKSVSECSGPRLWSLYLTLTALHIYANMQCMKLIVFDSLNTSRIKILAHRFLKEWDNGQVENDVTLLEPVAMARAEPLFFFLSRRGPSPYPIQFGAPFEHHIASDVQTNNVVELSQRLQEDSYVVSLRGRKVAVSLSKEATPRDKAKAYLHAVLVGRAAKDSNPDEVARVRLESAWPAFEKSCEQVGWNLDKTALQSRGYELSLE